MKFLFSPLSLQSLPAKGICAVYCLKNSQNGKIYVGGTSDLRSRMVAHFYKMKGGYHDSDAIAADAQVFGIGCWEWAIVEDCVKNVLRERETFWIEELGCCDPSIGYNVLRKGFGGPNAEHKQAFRAWCAERVKHARLVSPDGLEVVEVVSRVDFAKERGLAVKEVYAVISGRDLHAGGWALESTPRHVVYSPEGKRYSYVSRKIFRSVAGCSADLARMERDAKYQSKGWSQTIDNCLCNKAPALPKIPKQKAAPTPKIPITLISPDGDTVKFESRYEAIWGIGGDRSMIYKMIGRKRCGSHNVMSYRGWRLPPAG